MNVRIVTRPDRDDVVIYAWHETSTGGRLEVGVDGDRLGVRPDARNVPPHAETRPTLVMSNEDFAALTEAIRASGPHGSVEADALADTRMVRDRLLTLVEDAWRQ